MIVRQVFERWSIAVPPAMDEAFVADPGYWTAWDAQRSISLSSVAIADRRGRPIPGKTILRGFPAIDGERVEPPVGLDGWAVIVDVADSPGASRAISGMVVVDGCVLIATITTADLDWARSVWRSIHHHIPERRTEGLGVH
jgi:hypothetical protein